MSLEGYHGPVLLQRRTPIPSRLRTSLNNGELGGGDVKGIDVGSKTGEGLLGAIGPWNMLVYESLFPMFRSIAYLMRVLSLMVSTS